MPYIVTMKNETHKQFQTCDDELFESALSSGVKWAGFDGQAIVQGKLHEAYRSLSMSDVVSYKWQDKHYDY